MQNPLVTLKGMKVKTEGKLLKNCFNVSLPLIGERIVVGCGDVVFSALVAGLGTLSVAAHSIALTIKGKETLKQFFNSFPSGFTFIPFSVTNGFCIATQKIVTPPIP